MVPKVPTVASGFPESAVEQIHRTAPQNLPPVPSFRSIERVPFSRVFGRHRPHPVQFGPRDRSIGLAAASRILAGRLYFTRASSPFRCIAFFPLDCCLQFSLSYFSATLGDTRSGKHMVPIPVGRKGQNAKVY